MGANDDGVALQRVVDELAIRNLLARLHHTIDALRRGEATEEEYDDCWTDDGVWESPRRGRFRRDAPSWSERAASLSLSISTWKLTTRRSPARLRRGFARTGKRIRHCSAYAQ